MQKIIMYECRYCNKTYRTERDALRCEFEDIRCQYANVLLEEGSTLQDIEYWCHFGWTLPTNLECVDKDNCFTISWWQCCDKPAYQIREITKDGLLILGGCGSWSGYYGNALSIDRLIDPRPKEELYIAKRI